MLSDHYIHYDDEAGVEVNEDVPVDVKDGGMILDEDDSETVTKNKGEDHEEQGKKVKHEKHNIIYVCSVMVIKAIMEKCSVIKCIKS